MLPLDLASRSSLIVSQPFPVSPRNSAAAVINMMKTTNCLRIVTLHHAHQALIDDIREQSSGLTFTVEEMPNIFYAFPKLGREVEADSFVPYPDSASQPDANVPAIYIHSSGSTGFPKSIPQSFKTQLHWMYHSTSYLLPPHLSNSFRHQYGIKL